MKKLLTFLGCLLAYLIVISIMEACCSSNSVQTKTVNSQYSRVHIDGHGSYGVYKFNFDGHGYIMFKGVEQMAVVHNPDCHCHHIYN